MNIYCAKCKRKTSTTGETECLNKLGKPMVRGKCSVCKSMKTSLISKEQITKGGFVFTLPMLAAAAAAAGSLAGGASSIANSVNQKKAADKMLAERKRHNKALEQKKGSGLYLKPYKGKGMYLAPFKK